jgi:hypothetical protein
VCGLPAQHCVCHDCSCCDVQGARTECEARAGCNCGGSVSASFWGSESQTTKIMHSQLPSIHSEQSRYLCPHSGLWPGAAAEILLRAGCPVITNST